MTTTTIASCEREEKFSRRRLGREILETTTRASCDLEEKFTRRRRERAATWRRNSREGVESERRPERRVKREDDDYDDSELVSSDLEEKFTRRRLGRAATWRRNSREGVESERRPGGELSERMTTTTIASREREEKFSRRRLRASCDLEEKFRHEKRGVDREEKFGRRRRERAARRRVKRLRRLRRASRAERAGPGGEILETTTRGEQRPGGEIHDTTLRASRDREEKFARRRRERAATGRRVKREDDDYDEDRPRPRREILETTRRSSRDLDEKFSRRRLGRAATWRRNSREGVESERRPGGELSERMTTTTIASCEREEKFSRRRLGSSDDPSSDANHDDDPGRLARRHGGILRRAHLHEGLVDVAGARLRARSQVTGRCESTPHRGRRHQVVLPQYTALRSGPAQPRRRVDAAREIARRHRRLHSDAECDSGRRLQSRPSDESRRLGRHSTAVVRLRRDLWQHQANALLRDASLSQKASWSFIVYKYDM
ncbi:unnamed protein product [Trichogramma brassicae]|uniref:Uncharacterized protein n=1 Tax=Trichogramma brassicae TaxID=86971 RepID=A0A6H5ID18_9HYME|nr:unnamed protein product [Trichogramma brassicae]